MRAPEEAAGAQGWSASHFHLLLVEGDGRHEPGGRRVPVRRPFVDDHPPAVHQEVVEVVEDAVRRHLAVEGVGVGDVPQQLLLLAAGGPRHLVALPQLNQ